MDKSERTKENIITQTIQLINENNGDTNKITVRKIAERSKVGIGLINHYFESKDKLIEACVQSIIHGVIYSFKPSNGNLVPGKDHLKMVAKQVMDFLMDNQQISKISILGDKLNPKEMDNSMNTVRGFCKSITNNEPTNSELMKCYCLTSVLQDSFLRKDVLKSSIGVDFYEKSDRDVYIDCMIDTIFL